MSVITVRFLYAEIERTTFVPQQVTIIRNRFALTNEVDVTTVSSMPWELVAAIMLALAIALVIPATNTRLAEIVD